MSNKKAPIPTDKVKKTLKVDHVRLKRQPSQAYQQIQNLTKQVQNEDPDTAAVSKLMRDAKKGSPKALYHLGGHFMQGKGVSANPELAFKHFEHAASKGHINAYYSLGKCYEIGYGTKQNLEKAINCYEKVLDYFDTKYPVSDFLEESSPKPLFWPKLREDANSGFIRSCEALRDSRPMELKPRTNISVTSQGDLPEDANNTTSISRMSFTK